MKVIETDRELERVRREGKGFIYNDFGSEGGHPDEWKVLHRADCYQLERATVSTGKFLFAEMDEAMSWLNSERGKEGEGWKRCGTCLPGPVD